MQELPIVRHGERVVARPDGRGGLVLAVEKVLGREFAASAECTGFVLDARLLWDVLGSLKMPGSWFQVWCKLEAAQDASRQQNRDVERGYIRVTQRDLQTRCALTATSVSEPCQFFADIGWMRTAKRGVLQLNPWLTVAGTSAEQALWQRTWKDAGGPACRIPHPDYPAEWRDARKDAKKAAEAARRKEQVVTLPRRRQPPRKATA